jgi:hypothetical protein
VPDGLVGEDDVVGRVPAITVLAEGEVVVDVEGPFSPTQAGCCQLTVRGCWLWGVLPSRSVTYTNVLAEPVVM